MFVLALASLNLFIQTPCSLRPPIVDVRQNSKLTLEEDSTIRNSIYDGSFTTAVAKEGKWAGHTILIMPKQVELIYSKKPIATIKLLIIILEGARPHDALLAASYAMCLTVSPVAGRLTYQHSPDKFDTVIEGRKITSRQFISSVVRNQLSKLTKTGK